MKSLSLLKGVIMKTQVVKQTIHELVDQIEDNELLTLYLKLLEREIKKPISDSTFFATTDEDLVARAHASMNSIEKGDTRNIKDFKKDVDTWKKNRAM